MKHLPKILLYSRLLFVILIISLSILKPATYHFFIVVLVTVGLLSDIFDGIIARRLGVSTEKLRRMDTTIDTIFWLGTLVASYIIAPQFYIGHAVQLLTLIAAELICYGVSYMKFGIEIATHAISSKMWTLILFATLAQLIFTGQSAILFAICFYTGLINRAEIISILPLLRKWENDVPTVYHAVRIRNNKPIKRHKLFNG